MDGVLFTVMRLRLWLSILVAMFTRIAFFLPAQESDDDATEAAARTAKTLE